MNDLHKSKMFVRDLTFRKLMLILKKQNQRELFCCYLYFGIYETTLFLIKLELLLPVNGLKVKLKKTK